ncbi:MAG: hypothetical protein M3373_04525 [Gemmatimonadota bacterium]|nr:hypothetical protein [Gemmatimonadota bacterium]
MATGSYDNPNPPQDEQELQTALLRLNARAWGIAMGLFLGFGIFLATNFLVLKGGPRVGQHLELLRVFLPGYRVTFVGSVIGFVYLFVVGYILGRLIGAVYNRLVETGR